MGSELPKLRVRCRRQTWESHGQEEMTAGGGLGNAREMQPTVRGKAGPVSQRGHSRGPW